MENCGIFLSPANVLATSLELVTTGPVGTMNMALYIKMRLKRGYVVQLKNVIASKASFSFIQSEVELALA